MMCSKLLVGRLGSGDSILEYTQIYPSDRAVSSVIFLAEESREIVGAALAGQRVQRAVDEFWFRTVFKKR